MRGWSDCMERVAWSCFLVSGHVAPRMSSVNTITAMPKLPNDSRATRTMKLVIGTTKPCVQIQMMTWNRSTVLVQLLAVHDDERGGVDADHLAARCHKEHLAVGKEQRVGQDVDAERQRRRGRHRAVRG